MINTVYKVLKPLNIPVQFLERPAFDSYQTVISYHFFNQSEANYGDGKANEDIGSLQIDIFSYENYQSTVKDVRNLLSSANFMYVTGNDDIESFSGSKQIYHKVLIFNYIESEVIK